LIRRVYYWSYDMGEKLCPKRYPDPSLYSGRSPYYNIQPIFLTE
jgi:hypothetical protein